MKNMLTLLSMAVVVILIACQGEMVTVEAPADTPTPVPTYTPYPTLAALPTLEPLPTHTPYPTLEALPTHTPYPTATTAPPVIASSAWHTLDTEFGPVVGALGSDALGFWVMRIACTTLDAPGVFLSRSDGNIFSGAEESYTIDQFVTDIDGTKLESSWGYFESEPDYSDFFSALRPEILIPALIEAESLTLEITTDDDPYVIYFAVSGLSEHSKAIDALCVSE